MGRGGRGGGGGRSFGGGSRSFGGGSRSSFGGSVHRSSRSGSFRGTSSSFKSTGSSFNRGHSHFRGPGLYNSFWGFGAPRTHLHIHTGNSGYNGYVGGSSTRSGGNGGSGGSGSAGSVFLTIFVILLLMVLLFSCTTGVMNSTSGRYIEEDVLEEYAEDAYEEEFGDKDGYLIVLCAKLEGEYDEMVCTRFRGDAADTMEIYDDTFWQYYDDNYNDDLGIQLGAALSLTAEEMVEDGVEPLDGGMFDSTFYEDSIGYVDSGSRLKAAGEEFFEASGIQVRIRLVAYEDFRDDYVETTNGLTKVFIVLVIAAAVLALVYLLFRWWQAKKKQKNIEDENTIKILNTPLESFGDLDLEKTMEKYDDAAKSGDNAGGSSDDSDNNSGDDSDINY